MFAYDGGRAFPECVLYRIPHQQNIQPSNTQTPYPPVVDEGNWVAYRDSWNDYTPDNTAALIELKRALDNEILII